MNFIGKWIVVSAVAGACFVGGTKVAKADDCLEVGMRDKAGEWVWYPAFVDVYESKDTGRVHIRYEHKHGELELKVYEKEKADGEDVIVMKGRWFEGRDAQRSGKVRLEMEKGHHHARGWYSYGDGEESAHLDIQMRDCKRHGR
jgi:hypothetical protein